MVFVGVLQAHDVLDDLTDVAGIDLGDVVGGASGPRAVEHTENVPSLLGEELVALFILLDKPRAIGNTVQEGVELLDVAIHRVLGVIVNGLLEHASRCPLCAPPMSPMVAVRLHLVGPPAPPAGA